MESEKRRNFCDDQLLDSNDFVRLLKYRLSSIQTNNGKMSQPFSINFTSVFVSLADKVCGENFKKCLCPFLRY